ncbi:Mbeg1-like protein [Gardnerella pickettii]|uniref:Mbeg1-like protein n=1 Tax=Gardnerella pickettii TaxID=2914924 RepID=UPI003CFF18C2
MPNILDLLNNDFTNFEERKFNAVDSLILCELAYICMPESIPKYNDDSNALATVPLSELLRGEDFSSMFSSGSTKVDEFRKNLLLAVESSPRYRGMRVGEVLERFDESNIDDSCEQQFAAVTFDLTDCIGSSCFVVAFRGTDNTLVGWKEDFNMAFRCPVPAQESAAEYLLSISRRACKDSCKSGGIRGIFSSVGDYFANLFNKKSDFKNSDLDKSNLENSNDCDLSDNPKIFVVGHSKGGNMAAYAAMRLDAQDRSLGNHISKIYSMDGPSFGSDVVDPKVFSRVVSRIEKVVPQSAFIGLIMDTGVPYKVTAADSIGLMQHFGMYWQVKDGDFDYCDCVTPRALAVSKAANEWMMNLPFEERKRRIDSVYSMFSSLGYSTFDEMSSHWSEVVPTLLKIAMHMDSKTHELIRSVMSAFALAGGSDKKN